MKNGNIPFYFIAAALISLLIGLLFGVVGGIQYILPDFLNLFFRFIK